MRRWGSFLPGNGVGGGGVHWNGQTFRFLPSDFVAASHNTERYGPLPEGMTVQDYGVTYDELEPHFDRFEKLCGIGGKAGNLKGERQEGGNPFEGWRSDEYPNPPMHMTFAQEQFAKAARELNLNPFPAPVGQHEPRLHQSARRAARAMQLLRLLREIRLRQLFQGQRADHDPAGPDAEAELHAQDPQRGAACGARQRRPPRHWRRACRPATARNFSAGRDRDPVRLSARQTRG
jgi:choline dehydrogenase-like flavoprotein